ncbi:MAG: tryptophan--tRNA ligase [Candidatus Vogelbacteria bacterium]|nr:tryptophan--tRNA ligase [Candidatus Vogelbacteria bacterium]
MENGTIKRKIALTGDRPTGKMHLGHYVGSFKNRVKMQDDYDQFILVADVQALTDNADNPAKIRANILETTIDNIACGVDPHKNTFFIQSMVPEIADLTIYFLNLVTVSRLIRNPTVKDEVNQKGYGQNIPAGFMCYPVSQAADILCVKACVVPAGEDQLPMIEQTNEIVDKFNALYTATFPRVKAIVPRIAARLSGTDGKSKMGKSTGNAIFLADSSKVLAEKVMNMYTDPAHIHATDPGHIEGNVVFEYLDVFDNDPKGLGELKEKYKAGGVGDVVIKKRLIEVLENEIGPIRRNREELAQNSDQILKILKEGTERACNISAKTLRDVKTAMQINYF